MSFKKIIGLFVDYNEDEKEDEKIEEEKIEKKSSSPIPPVISSPPITENTNSIGETNEQIMESLAKTLEKANLEGFDYFEFAKILDNLKEKMPSEQARFQAAFASSNVMGASKDKLLETAQYYIGILDKESEKFEIFYANQLKRTVEDKENRLNEIDSSINGFTEEIERLTNQINDLTNEKSSINNEIIENKGKAEKVKSDFTCTLNIFLKKINGDIEKIKKYLTE